MPDPAIVILAGGVGTRFWPLSTSSRPKQFLQLLGERSLLQESYDRARLLAGPERILVLTAESLVPLVREQLPELSPLNVIGEPCRRDTGAAVALGALLLRERFDDPVMAVLTADHRISPPESFVQSLSSALEAAGAEPVLYTFGIRPAYAATGYGYLHVGRRLDLGGEVEHRELIGFREKPDRETAAAFLRSGGYLWNSGMFAWSVGTILGELKRHLPEHLEILAPLAARFGEPGWEQALGPAFERLASVSIDYGVMEKAGAVRAVVADFSWSDLGGWLALREFLPADAEGNRHRGRLAAWEAGGNLVFSEDPDELVALVGVRQLVVVRAGNRTLIVDQEHAEEIKELVRALERDGQGRYL